MMNRMIASLNKHLSGALVFGLTLLTMPQAVLAQDDMPKHDARLEGYAESVLLQGSGTAMTWLLLLGLAVLCLSVLFKDARRTHLD